ncbi:hypothetical protein FS842_004905 [Serendipita sp. 407]|nr:hypothetical protein FS842_004905 [Serendipita sp. 407]
MVRSTPLLRFAQAVRRTLTQPSKQSYGYNNGYGGSGGGGGGWGSGGGGGGYGGVEVVEEHGGDLEAETVWGTSEEV